MSAHECPPEPALGPALLAAARLALAAIRQHLTHPDPKVALRAASELTKLLAVCARNGIRVEGEEGDRVADSRRESVGPAAEQAELDSAERPHPPAPSPSRRGGVQGDDLSGRTASVAEKTSADGHQHHPLEHPLSVPERGPGGEVFSTSDPAAKRPRRAAFHERRRDRPPPETARPPSALPS